jgi:hypothetical protein
MHVCVMAGVCMQLRVMMGADECGGWWVQAHVMASVCKCVWCVC